MGTQRRTSTTRVRIGICTGPADAALVRAMLAAHDIDSVVGGEHHANLLGGLGGALIALDITVAEDDAEEAVQLLREYREGGAADAGDAAQDDDDAADDSAEPDESMALDTGAELGFERRKQIGAAMLLAVCISFGTAHMYARAWKRGVILAAVEIGAFSWVVQGQKYGALLVLGCVFTDAVGAIRQINRTLKSRARASLPVARVR